MQRSAIVRCAGFFCFWFIMRPTAESVERTLIWYTQYVDGRVPRKDLPFEVPKTTLNILHLPFGEKHPFLDRF